MTTILFKLMENEGDKEFSRVLSARLLEDRPIPEKRLFFPAGSIGFVLSSEKELSMVDGVLPDHEAQNLFSWWYDSLRRRTFLVLFPEGIVELRPSEIEIFPASKYLAGGDAYLDAMLLLDKINGRCKSDDSSKGQ
jgi:hypothetical protein